MLGQITEIKDHLEKSKINTNALKNVMHVVLKALLVIYTNYFNTFLFFLKLLKINNKLLRKLHPKDRYVWEVLEMPTQGPLN